MTRMAWQRVEKRKRKRKGSAESSEQKDLARSFLEALIGSPRRQQRHQELGSKDWKCPQCSF